MQRKSVRQEYAKNTGADIVTEGFGTLTGPEEKAQVKIPVTPEKDLLG